MTCPLTKQPIETQGGVRVIADVQCDHKFELQDLVEYCALCLLATEDNARFSNELEINCPTGDRYVITHILLETDLHDLWLATAKGCNMLARGLNDESRALRNELLDEVSRTQELSMQKMIEIRNDFLARQPRRGAGRYDGNDEPCFLVTAMQKGGKGATVFMGVVGVVMTVSKLFRAFFSSETTGRKPSARRRNHHVVGGTPKASPRRL